MANIDTDAEELYRVKLFDTAYPVDTSVIVADYVTKAAANSIARHGNKIIRKMEREAGAPIGIWHHVDNVDNNF